MAGLQQVQIDMLLSNPMILIYTVRKVLTVGTFDAITYKPWSGLSFRQVWWLAVPNTDVNVN
jgi:hypothetical protein